jgi:hypothetical protein
VQMYQNDLDSIVFRRDRCRIWIVRCGGVHDDNLFPWLIRYRECRLRSLGRMLIGIVGDYHLLHDETLYATFYLCEMPFGMGDGDIEIVKQQSVAVRRVGLPLLTIEHSSL